MRTPDEALDYWHARIDFEKRPAQPGDLKLDWMRRLLHRLGDPHRRLRIVHVAGTKGKGSTCAMLAAVLRAAGYRVGLFTSPHLHDVSERIQVDGQPISRPEILARMVEIESAERGMETGPNPQASTFFEIATALGFLHFDCRRVEIAVVEVGLGGRFDSTNVVDPLLSIITDISLDHTAFLGNTLAQIAFEKAGIIKPNRTVVSTASDAEARSTIARIAGERKAPLALIGRDFGPAYYPLTLLGTHQKANAGGVIAAVELLRKRGFTIPDAAVRRGLAGTRWPARVEQLGTRPLVILDCAHNPASAAALVETLAADFPVPGKKHLVVAVSNDKPLPETLAPWIAHFDTFHCCRYGINPRCVPPERLAELVRERRPDASVSIYATSAAAWAAARAAAGPDDAVVVAGSVFLAGELRGAILAP